MHAHNVILEGLSTRFDYSDTLVVTAALLGVVILEVIFYSYSYGFQRIHCPSILETTKLIYGG